MATASIKELNFYPDYFSTLYEKALEQISNRKIEEKLYFWKWEKDVLLALLEKAMPRIKRKYLRRKVNKDLKKIKDFT